MGLFTTLIIGALAGWITGLVMRGAGYSWIVNVALGIVGSLVGGWLTSIFLGVNLVTGLNLTTLVVSVIGAIIVVAISRLVTGRRVRG
ncbi:MAG: GlsB/YeaQ/YmgE family stress response membrane protein [Chloroflexi bacterium OHK40]